MVTLTPEKIELTMVDVEGNNGHRQESAGLRLPPLDKVTDSVNHRTPAISNISETPETAIPEVSSGHTELDTMTKTDNATAKAVSQPVLIYRRPFDGTVTARTHWNTNGCFSTDKNLYRKLPDNGQVSQDLTREIHGAPALAGPVRANGDKHLHNSWGLLLNTSIEKIILLLTLDEFRQYALVAALITIRRRALDILKRAAAAIKQTIVKVAIAGLLTAGVMPVALLPATVPLRTPGSVLKAAAERKANNMVVKMPVENAGFVNGKTVLAVVTDQADYEHTMEVYNARLAARGTPQEKEAQRAWDKLSAESAMRSH